MTEQASNLTENKQGTDQLTQQLEKSVKRWEKASSISAIMCGASFGVALFAGMNENQEDDYLVPLAGATMIASATFTGASLAKKDEKEVQLGKPSTLWPKVAKGSALVGLLSLGVAIIAGMTEDKGDNVFVPVAGLGAALSFVACGFSYAKSFERRKMKLLFHKTKRKTLKTAVKLKRMLKKEKILPEKIISLKESLFSSTPLLWDTFSNQLVDKNFAKTMDNIGTVLNPNVVVKSTLPLVQKFGVTHSRG